MPNYATLMEARRDLVTNTCTQHQDHFFKTAKDVNIVEYNYMVDESRNLLVCLINKIASSFWMRIFYVLNHARHPGFFNLSSEDIHAGVTNKFAVFQGQPFIRRAHWLLMSKRFMFVRDPYERLFSGWADKFFVPFGLPPFLDAVVKKLGGKNAAAPKDARYVKRCGLAKGVSFTDLVRFLVDSHPNAINEHFRSYSHQCFPCHVHYDFIGKMETFDQDVAFILRSVNVDPNNVYNVSGDGAFEEKNALNFMNGVVERAFGRWHANCSTTLYNMMRRIWVAFKVRGYVSLNLTFPLSMVEARSTSVAAFKAIATKAYRDTPDHAATKKQRRQAFLEAYYSLPRPLLKKLEAYVADDCKLFGYECDIESRFNLSDKPPTEMFHFDKLMFSED
ncbi:carbohydrate sulfotransferase 11-like isoform X2 [Littorina saxatilis]|uniref:carbohydrate sulfotransferase 11-like isoform X2 n=1 Tax=Littorina saxatilis TaxID=31220 RepID=UPI0038B64819